MNALIVAVCIVGVVMSVTAIAALVLVGLSVARDDQDHPGPR